MNSKQVVCRLQDSDLMNIGRNMATFNDALFAFAKPPKNGVIHAACSMTYCRESICEYVRQQIKKVNSFGINTKMLNIIVYRRVPAKTGAATFQRQVEIAQRILHTIEGHYGWPLTRVYLAKLPNDQVINPRNVFYYMRSTKRWLKSPAMLSMYLLLFRIACQSIKSNCLDDIPSFEGLFKILSEMARKGRSQELGYFRVHGDRWPLVLDNYQKLFGWRTLENLYWPNKKAYLFSEGINRLCDGETEDSLLNSQFQKVIQEAT